MFNKSFVLERERGDEKSGDKEIKKYAIIITNKGSYYLYLYICILLSNF